MNNRTDIALKTLGIVVVFIIIGFLLVGCSKFNNKTLRSFSIDVHSDGCEKQSVLIDYDRDTHGTGEAKGTMSKGVGK